MSPREDDEQKPVVAVFRSAVFNASERFIQDQAAALTRWRPLVVGLERKGEVVPRLREGMIVAESAGERLAFRLRGRGGTHRGGAAGRAAGADPRSFRNRRPPRPAARAGAGRAADHQLARL